MEAKYKKLRDIVRGDVEEKTELDRNRERLEYFSVAQDGEKELENEEDEDDSDKAEDKKDEKELIPGVAPCWPPTCYVLDKTMQLKEAGLTKNPRNPILKPPQKLAKLGQYSPKKSVRFATPESKLLLKPREAACTETNYLTQEFEEAALNKALNDSDSVDPRYRTMVPYGMSCRLGYCLPSQTCCPPFSRNYNMGRPYPARTPQTLAPIQLSSVDARLVLPPEPLSACLQPAGDRVVHKLGLRYKTEAHRR